jgi:hypothetical protein
MRYGEGAWVGLDRDREVKRKELAYQLATLARAIPVALVSSDQTSAA